MALLVPELLDTPRLRLRPFAEDDLDAFAAITADAQTMRFIGEGVTADRMLTWRWLATTIGHWQMRGYGPWAVEEKASGALLGRVGLWRPEGWPGVEVMWTIRRSSWGRGFAPEAAAVARDAAFEHLLLDRLCSLIVPENTASIGSPRRLAKATVTTCRCSARPSACTRSTAPIGSGRGPELRHLAHRPLVGAGGQGGVGT